jgi:hypothetical protein
MLLGVFFGGCAGTADTAEPDSEVSEDELQAMKVYDCQAFNRDASPSRFELGFSAKKIVVTDIGKDALPAGIGTFDPNYRPQSTSLQGAARFRGFDKMVDADISDASSLEVLVSSEIRANKPGRVTLRWGSGSGPASESYTCKAKASRLVVNIATNARLACDLDKLSCQDGPAPGNTCLASAFAFEANNGTSSLKLNYYDHFGVRATERSESVGSSTAFARTKTKVTGAWNSVSLNVKYRAGITYTGTMKVGAETVNVKCNDLSMLD